MLQSQSEQRIFLSKCLIIAFVLSEIREGVGAVTPECTQIGSQIPRQIWQVAWARLRGLMQYQSNLVFYVDMGLTANDTKGNIRLSLLG